MEESKDLQSLYKIFRTFIYLSLVVEFFEYAINPEVLDFWGEYSLTSMTGSNSWMFTRTATCFAVRS